MAAGLLTAIDMPELIVETLEEHEALALALASCSGAAGDPHGQVGGQPADHAAIRRRPLLPVMISAAYATMMEIAREGEALRPT